MSDGCAMCEDAAEEPAGPQPVPAGPRRRRPFLVFARRGGKVVVSLMSVAVLALTWCGWRFIGDPNEGLTTTQVFDSQQPHVQPLDGAVDILLVGMDSRTDAQGNPLPQEVLDTLHAGESDGERNTDTMILVHIPENGQRAVAISFPRDSWVELAGGFGKDKLNSAFVYAYNDTSRTLQQQGMSDLREVDRQAKVAGRKNLIATLGGLIGEPGMIDRYAEVNLASFYEITKALGGVDVCLNHAVKEPRSGIDLPAGRQTISGVQALAFVRQRYDLVNADLDRIARQQAFLSGLARKVLSRDVLMNPGRIADVIGAVKKSVVLSDNWDLAEFAGQMRGLNSGKVEFHTIPVAGPATIGGADVLRVDPADVRQFVDHLTTDPTTPAPPSTGPATPAPTGPLTPPSTGPATPASPGPVAAASTGPLTSTSTPTTSTKRGGAPATSPTAPPVSVQPPITGGEIPCVN